MSYIDTTYIITAVVFYLFSYIYYLKISHGLGNKATYLQLRRFIPCAILSVLPAALAGLPLSSPLFIIPTIIAILGLLRTPLFTSSAITRYLLTLNFTLKQSSAFISSPGFLLWELSCNRLAGLLFLPLSLLLLQN